MNYYHPKFDLEPASQPIHLEEAQAFRYKAFGGVSESGLDRDEYDKKFNHVIIRDRKHRRVVGCFRYTYIPLVPCFKVVILQRITISTP